MGSILGTIRKDTGSIQILGEEMDPDNKNMKENIGDVFDDIHSSGGVTVNKLGKVFQNIYQQWDQKTFEAYTTLSTLPKNQKISSYYRGMSKTMTVAVALSHYA